jgi:preprotein translocase subunit SecD
MRLSQTHAFGTFGRSSGMFAIKMKILYLLVALIALTAVTVYADVPAVQFLAVLSEQTSASHEVEFNWRNEIRSLHVLPTPIISDPDIESAEVSLEQPNTVNITLSEAGGVKFKNGIKDLLGKQIAIVVNGNVVSAPVLQAVDFGRKLQIAGTLSDLETQSLVEKLNRK